MFTIQIKPIAIIMAKEAYNWYEEQKIGLGDLFLAELSRCYTKLEKNPFFYQKLKRITVI
jgi:toxin ParE1/3/4